MRPSLRFLGLCVAGWAGVRAYTMGALPALSLTPSAARAAPPIVPTEFPPIDPPPPDAPPVVEAASPPPMTYAQYPQALVAQVRPLIQRVYYGVGSVRAPLPPARQADPILISPDAGLYSRAAYAGSPLADLPSQTSGARSTVVAVAGQSRPVWTDAPTNRLDRIQASGWALVRGQQGQPIGPSSLASGGQLGGSQAGGRLIYNFNRQIAASARYSSDIGRRGGEFAAGVRVQPLGGIPVWVTAERRQRLGKLGGGRNDFAIFAESGLYQRPMPMGFNLDTYLQAGIVGVRSRDYFVDGALAFTRPVYKNFSLGFGMWGGAQPGLYRLDAGPRLTMQVRRNLKVHVDYRQKLLGNAQPGSGPALTLAADF